MKLLVSVFGHQDNPAYLPRWPKVVVISYKMLQHLRTTMLEREWALLIVDESHHLRCSKKKSDPPEVCKNSFSSLMRFLSMASCVPFSMISWLTLITFDKHRDDSVTLSLTLHETSLTLSGDFVLFKKGW